jgi:hypothetical protein
VEPDQVHVVAASVPRNLQQILNARESGFAGEIIRDVLEVDRFDRIHDDMAFAHGVATTDFDVRAHPDANGAPDSAAANPFAQMLGELHVGLWHANAEVDWKVSDEGHGRGL